MGVGEEVEGSVEMRLQDATLGQTDQGGIKDGDTLEAVPGSLTVSQITTFHRHMERELAQGLSSGRILLNLFQRVRWAIRPCRRNRQVGERRFPFNLVKTSLGGIYLLIEMRVKPISKTEKKIWLSTIRMTRLRHPAKLPHPQLRSPQLSGRVHLAPHCPLHHLKLRSTRLIRTRYHTMPMPMPRMEDTHLWEINRHNANDRLWKRLIGQHLTV